MKLVKGGKRHGRSATRPCLNAWDFKGIIVQRAVANYHLYPATLKAWVSIDDLIQDGIVWLQPVLAKYDPSRGKPSTFVYKAIDNFYKGYLTILSTQKRTAQLITIDDRDKPVDIPVHTGQNIEALLDAARVVTKLHERASLELVRFLDAHFFSHTATKVVIGSDKFNRCRREFRRLAKEEGVTIDHYRLAIRIEASRRHNGR